MSSTPSGCASSALVDRHFAGRLAPTRERTMRAHLPGCAACRTRYERHLLLAEVDPRALEARERLARGLGLSDARLAKGRRRGWLPALGLVSALALVFVVVGPTLVRNDEAGFTARGGSPTPLAANSLQVFRATAGGEVDRVGTSIGPDDELAFAYRNPGQWPFLMVFGVDEQGGVFWYHPAWTDAETNPRSVPAFAGEGPHELTEAVRQPLSAGRFTLYALFSQAPLTVREVEAALVRGGPRTLVGTDRSLEAIELEVDGRGEAGR